MHSFSEARSINHICLALQDGSDDVGDFLGEIFQVCVLNDGDYSSGMAEARPNRCSLALVFFVAKVDDAVLIGFCYFGRAVGRAIVNEDNFFIQGERDQSVKNCRECFLLVVSGDDDGDVHGCRFWRSRRIRFHSPLVGGGCYI